MLQWWAAPVQKLIRKSLFADGRAPVYDCLTAGLLPNEASNFQSAEVLLGLTPTLLATLAPSIGEISLVSTRRSILALLLAVANPSIYVSRLLAHQDPSEYLQRGGTAFPEAMLNPSGRQAIILSMLQYVLAAGAIANVVQLSWELGFRTLIAWKCNDSYLSFLWTVMPLVVHIFAAVGWHISTPVRSINHPAASTGQVAAHSTTGLRRRLLREVQLPCQYAPLSMAASVARNTGRARDKPAVFLNELAGFWAFLHLLFGTTVFSSLMFISVLDALKVIARYIASGLVC